MEYEKGTSSASVAVLLQNAEVSFGIGPNKTEVLKQINLSINVGSIYGLLGPSGCGKTTLLKCVVALLKPDKGFVRVFNQTPGSTASNIPGWKVGYMPQELALYSELTTEETLAYFGRLHHMDSSHIRARTEFLLKFLSFSHPKSWVQHLSGGEQRRVSLAIALLHEPPLLILDEPTVGVDPILRKNIWNYLTKIATNDNVTTIITTHYVEEARLADKVGLMRNGRLMAQDKPLLLLEKYNVATLEEVFIIISQENMSNQEEGHFSTVSLELNSEKQQSYSIKDAFKPPSYRRINALVVLNFTTMWRNFALFLFQFLSPACQILVFFWAWSDPTDLHVAIFNQDNVLGIQYLQCINNETIHQMPVSNLDEGVHLVQDGKAWAVINIWPNFTTAHKQRFSSSNNKEIIDASTIHIRHDNTDQIIFYDLEEALFNAYYCFLKKSNNTQQLPPTPIQFGKPIYGPEKGRFVDNFAPGVLTGCVFSMAMGLAAMSYVTIKVSGLLERTYVSGATSFELLCGYVITQLGVIMIQSGIVIITALGLFDVKNNGSPVWLFLLSLLIGITGMSFGFFISTISNDGTTALMLGLGSYMPLFFTSGFTFMLF